MGWTVTIGQGAGIRTQQRVVDIQVIEEFAHKEFVVIIQKPIQIERDQAKGRVDAAIIQIKRGSDILIEGFIEDVEKGHDIIKYSGRSFLVLLGYTTSSETASGGATEAEYEDDTGVTIINDLINSFCVPHDAEITYTDVTFAETYDGIVKLHGKKVYDIIRNMCIDYSRDLWSDATWNGDGINIDNKNIHVGTKSRGNVGAPQKTLRGGQHLKNIPVVKYRSSQNVINRIRVIGKGSGKEKVSVIVDDAASQATFGVIEGSPYNNNMIITETTAKAVGQAIIDAKKDLVEELQIDLITYISDLKYGDWVRIVDSYSSVDTTQRVKKISKMYNSQRGESISIEIGMPFDNYETLIKDLTKGDVDEEAEMSKGGGSLRITANDPPNDWVRVEKGSWYGTDGVFYEWDTDTSRVFWAGDPPYHATTVDNYFKALIQIKDAAAAATDIEYKTSMTAIAHTGSDKATAKADAIAPDDGYTPLGEIILKCEIVDGTVYAVTATDEGESFIYRDVRPIIGSSSTGYGGDPVWEKTGTPEYARLIIAQDIDLQDKILHFHKSISNMRIYRSGDNLIINPASTVSSVGIGGILSAQYGISNCDGITMHDSGSTLDMNYASIIDSGDIELYDATSTSPRLCFKTPTSEGHSGGYFESHATYLDLIRYSDGTDVMTWWYDTKKVDVWGKLDMNASNIDMALGDIENIDVIDAGYTTGISIEDSTGATKLILARSAATSYSMLLNDILEMNGNDIIKCKDIKGQTTGTDGANRLNLDFRGDASHRIYYTGVSDNRLKYETVSGHLFSINSVDICQVHSAGINMASGKYIKSDSGDLELRAPSGSKIKFVIG